jgi:predicted O-methyltransferase YrrM
VPPDPYVSPDKAPLPREELQFYPRMYVTEHPRRWAFPAYLDNPNSRWLQQLKALYAMPISFPASLSVEAGLLLHALVRNIRPRVVIETGTFVGVSALWIAAALAENGDNGELHSFDDFAPVGKGPWREVEMPEGRMEFVAAMIAGAGLSDHVVIHPGNSSFEIRAAHEEFKVAGGVQLAFLDADHGVVGAWQDMWATEPVLNTGGFVMFHDTLPEYCGYEGGRHVLDNLDRCAVGVYEKVDLYVSPMNYGLGLIRRIG